MNKVILIGRFTRDPESRMGSNSLEVSRFSLACLNDFVNKSGERDVEFINCVAFGKTAETINKYCTKGQMISATGRIKNNSYEDKEGNKRYTTDIIVDSFEFLSSKRSKSNEDITGDNVSFDKDIEVTDVTEDPYKDFGEEVNISSEDLPF
ncbi:MAG: single-stranded DNA-binding protein [Mollicutes bacterium]|nr:single-stranded DNA-binding protein [Mollicutes bacterium]